MGGGVGRSVACPIVDLFAPVLDEYRLPVSGKDTAELFDYIRLLKLRGLLMSLCFDLRLE
jgi:hypothetical protein